MNAHSIVMTKSEADKILVESLFDADGTLTPQNYDGGKYKWLGSQKAHIDRSKEEIEAFVARHWVEVRAVWFERRSDGEGVYCQVRCLA